MTDQLAPLPAALLSQLAPYLPSSGASSINSSNNNNNNNNNNNGRPIITNLKSLHATTSNGSGNCQHQLPYTTLTYAMSLDGLISAGPGLRTLLSGAVTKRMTHELRRRHAAILVGAGTFAADDPALNCRIALAADEEGRGSRNGSGIRESTTSSLLLAQQPRPLILDPRLRAAVAHLHSDSTVVRRARCGMGLSPWFIADAGAVTALSAGDGGDSSGGSGGAAQQENLKGNDYEAVLAGCGGRIIRVPGLLIQHVDNENDSAAVQRRPCDSCTCRPGFDDTRLKIAGSTAHSQHQREPRVNWFLLLRTLRREYGITSVMVEGGSMVIQSLLEASSSSTAVSHASSFSAGFKKQVESDAGLDMRQEGQEQLVNSVIVTIAPTWLGQGGVPVCPARQNNGVGAAVARLRDVRWIPMEEDVVMCGRI